MFFCSFLRLVERCVYAELYFGAEFDCCFDRAGFRWCDLQYMPFLTTLSPSGKYALSPPLSFYNSSPIYPLRAAGRFFFGPEASPPPVKRSILAPSFSSSDSYLPQLFFYFRNRPPFNHVISFLQRFHRVSLFLPEFRAFTRRLQVASTLPRLGPPLPRSLSIPLPLPQP